MLDISEKHTSEKERQYIGEPMGSSLALWLNREDVISQKRRGTPAAVKRVGRLLTALQTMNPDAIDVEQAKEFTDQWKFHLAVVVPDEQGRNLRAYFEPTGKSWDEGWAIRILLWLSEDDLHHRLRHCDHCGKWFFQHNRTQMFCAGGKCRKAHRERSEEYKEYHRALMRRRYQAKKVLPIKKRESLAESKCRKNHGQRSE